MKAPILAAIAYVGMASGLWLLDHVYFYRPVSGFEKAAVLESAEPEAEAEAAAVSKARRALRGLIPRTVYVVVDTSSNRLQVRRGAEVLLDTLCSTGSGGILEDPETGRKWIFRTPQGIFTVARKAVDPVWTKPDWAFVEEGKPLPERWSERRDYDTLGDYALYFGDGYMIHGTLYQRYLGRSITHGCVRVGDADLKRVYELTPVGARIYIF